MAKTATLLWIDLEMTGLVPGKDKIMEIAAIATDWELEPLAEFTATVKVSDEVIKERMVGPFWKENKESYDALVSKNEEGKSAEEVEKDLLNWISKNFASSAIPNDPKYKGKIILAGNSIHQDRKFIDIEWPELSKKLHYRMLDVSAWKLYFEGAKHLKYTKREDHRALSDIKGSISELKWYLTFVH
ncbi:oligoribonuclease [Candidatus Saccharibacteria bacterium]|nr:oligoribonuclease [Candidatus Saccharibacteria bacterium]MBQ3306361.1 oligoribonuclease [Candidatus Saccharibacteria bacterium]